MERAVTLEQKAKYNARKRRKYAERGDYYETVVAGNAAWRAKNREVNNRRRREKRKLDAAWREAQNAKRRGRDQRKHQLKTNYGMTQEQYAEMLASQEGKCAVCGSVPNETLCVDHCHRTGKIRSLLCRKCNTGLGCFGDDSSLLGSAIKYLEKWR